MRKLTKKDLFVILVLFLVIATVIVVVNIINSIEKKQIIEVCTEFCDFDTLLCFPESSLENGITDEEAKTVFANLEKNAEIFTETTKNNILEGKQRVILV